MLFPIRFKITIVTIILVVILSLSFSVFSGLWLASSKMAEETATNLFSSVSLNSRNDIDRLLQEAVTAATLGAVQGDVKRIAYDGRESGTFPFLIEALKRNSAFYSMYFGFADGTFFQVISARDHEQIRTIHNAPEQTHWIVRSIFERAITDVEMRRVQQWTFLDAKLGVLSSYDEPAPQYDPRKRDWYINVIDNADAGLSSAYIFNSLKQPGITASKRLSSGQGVFGVDLTLTGLAQSISATKVSENGGVLLYDHENRLLAASSELGHYVPLEEINGISRPAIRAALQAKSPEQSGALQHINEGGVEFLVNPYKITLHDARLNLTVVAPKSDFQTHFIILQRQILLFFGLGIVFFVPVSYWFASRLARHITQLARDVKRVGDLKFLTETPAQSRILEFNDLIQAFSKMNNALAKKTKDLEMEQDKLTRLVDLGIAMSAEQDSDKLMEMILLGAKDLTNADGGTLYIVDDQQKLQFQIVRNDTLNIAMGGMAGPPAGLPGIPLFDEHGKANETNVVSCAVHQKKAVNIPDAYNASSFDFSGTRAFDQKNKYKSTSFLTVPLKPRGGDIIGAIQIINARNEGSDDIIPFSKDVQPYIEALAAQAATALYNRDLLDAQDLLMDALIHIIAGAIDAKSPYTGGHCSRVPELSIMLAREAGKVDTGYLADFNFKTREEWREFEIGAWLHDCGKVITPEHIVDKATKLETIYNRIHEIRTRFEVLIRDAEIEYLKSLVQGLDETQASKEFADRKKTLFDDFNFVAASNTGGEFMEDRDIARLRQIAKTTWVRHFDIRQGLSYEDLKRYKNEPDAPCEERLLDDKASHITPWDESVNDNYSGMSFKVDIPENRYNNGELYNLMIERGTLTEEERFKINEHIMHTIAMLEKLPLPKHMQRIPEYAGTHHETIIGTGYPRKLNGSELSVPSRIMAIADIFEALTASDRPYKKAKTLSEAVRILSIFKKNKHIDPVLFDLFLTSGVYRQYAENFLDSEQIDEVEIAPYLG